MVKKIKPRKKRFYKTNDLAREWLINQGYTQIWLKTHARRKDTIWMKRDHHLSGKAYIVKYQATDLWNLFDGICFDDCGCLHFLQIKTDGWPNKNQIVNFLEDKQGVYVLAINVKTRIKNGPKVETKVWGG